MVDLTREVEKSLLNFPDLTDLCLLILIQTQNLFLPWKLNNFWYYLFEGYLLFPTVPRNVHVGSITSVDEHKHF